MIGDENVWWVDVAVSVWACRCSLGTSTVTDERRGRSRREVMFIRGVCITIIIYN